ncbi:MAG: hypothetical protein JSW67_07645 [Candidatus Latescibacterota bacterium]|nr:MAG: hypothetical protein JSW67_07645 [Candidatus Latescibacterota bacterium]
MRRFLSILALALAVSVSYAFEAFEVTNGDKQIRVENGQTIELTASGFSAEVEFDVVTPTLVTGRASSLDGRAGTLLIRWINRGIEEQVEVIPQQPDQQFGLEGGDGDKRSIDDVQ